MTKSLYILDGHYLIYRAFYSLPQQLSSPIGEPTGATHGFCMMLFSLIRDRRPDYLAVAMDVSDETVFRREIDPEYKAHRDPSPEALNVQVDRVVSIVEALNIPLLRVPGFEADDLMATIAERLRDEDIFVYLVSRDKDLDQLLSERVRLYDPTKGEEIDPAKLFELKGFTPEQAVEIQSLVGDSTDNIKGVSGVGPKTAVKLIQQYGSAQGVLDHVDELTPKMAEKVRAFAENYPRTRELVTLRRDVPFDFDLNRCTVSRLSVTGVRPIFDELGFTTVREALSDVARVVGAEEASKEGNVETSKRQNDAKTNKSHVAGYQLVDTSEKLAEFVKLLEQQSVFAFDTETTGLHPVKASLVGLSFAFGTFGSGGEVGAANRSAAYYLPVRGMGATLDESEVARALMPIMENPAQRKVGHNIKYDILVLRQIGVRTAGVHFDTMLASFLLEPLRPSHSLDALVKALIGHEMIPITDLIGKGRNQITMDQLDTRAVCDYAAEDAEFTWRLYEIFEPQMTGSSFEPLFRDTEMPLIDVLADMEHNGIALDVPLLKKISSELEDRLIELTRQVHEAAGHKFNIDSTKQLATVLFDELGFKPVRRTKTGRSTDAETLETLAAQSEHPVPRLVLEYRELIKLKNTYLDTLPTMVHPRTGRVHASFNQTGAITGRLSSNDPNLQNIPIRTETGRRIRHAFIAGDPNSVLLTADYSQIELRLMAHFSKDEALCAAFREGQDVHRAVAAQVNGVELDEVTPAQRSAAKAVNFGIIYGQSAFGLSRSIGIPVSDARTFIERYFEQYPGIRRFIDECIDRAKTTGYAETILGRRRPIPELQSRNGGQRAMGERLAVNTVVQGSAADLIKRAMIDIHAELVSGKVAGKMLIQVHDELVFEVPAPRVEALAGVVREKMEGAFRLEVPIVVDVAWGRNWGETK
jgi:DNA polymerase I